MNRDSFTRTWWCFVAAQIGSTEAEADGLCWYLLQLYLASPLLLQLPPLHYTPAYAWGLDWWSCPHLFAASSHNISHNQQSTWNMKQGHEVYVNLMYWAILKSCSQQKGILWMKNVSPYAEISIQGKEAERPNNKQRLHSRLTGDYVQQARTVWQQA